MTQLDLRNAVRNGLLAGVIILGISAVGMVESFDQRDLITGVFTLGQLILFSSPAVIGYLITKKRRWCGERFGCHVWNSSWFFNGRAPDRTHPPDPHLAHHPQLICQRLSRPN